MSPICPDLGCMLDAGHAGAHRYLDDLPVRASPELVGERDDNEASLRLVHALRGDPARAEIMRVLAALGDASKGLPIHYTWNKLWWLLYTHEPAKPKPTTRRRKKR